MKKRKKSQKRKKKRVTNGPKYLKANLEIMKIFYGGGLLFFVIQTVNIFWFCSIYINYPYEKN